MDYGLIIWLWLSVKLGRRISFSVRRYLSIVRVEYCSWLVLVGIFHTAGRMEERYGGFDRE